MLLPAFVLAAGAPAADRPRPAFRVLAFYTHRDDLAHVSFARAANVWFAGPGPAARASQYDATDDWRRLNDAELARQDVVALPRRPSRRARRSARRSSATWRTAARSWASTSPASRSRPRSTRRTGTGTTTSSSAPAPYVSNTWRPTAAALRVDDADAPGTRGLPHDLPLARRTSGTAGSATSGRTRTSDVLLVDRPVELPARHGPEAARDLAPRRLPGRVDEHAVPDGLREHGPRRHGLRARDEPRPLVDVRGARPERAAGPGARLARDGTAVASVSGRAHEHVP